MTGRDRIIHFPLLSLFASKHNTEASAVVGHWFAFILSQPSKQDVNFHGTPSGSAHLLLNSDIITEHVNKSTGCS